MQVIDDFPLATLRQYIDWTPFFHTWELRGVYPAILEAREIRRAGAHDLRGSQWAARRDHREEAAARTRRVRAIPGERRGRRRGALCGYGAKQGAVALPFSPAANGEEREARAAPQPGRLHRAEEHGPPRPHWSVRREHRFWVEGAVRDVPRPARRLQRHHGRGHRRPVGGSVRGVSARASAPRVGLRQERSADAGRSHRREVPRHKAGGRIPGVPRRIPRRARCGSSSMWRRTRACSSPSRSPCGPAPA